MLGVIFLALLRWASLVCLRSKRSEFFWMVELVMLELVIVMLG